MSFKQQTLHSVNITSKLKSYRNMICSINLLYIDIFLLMKITLLVNDKPLEDNNIWIAGIYSKKKNEISSDTSNFDI